MVDHYKVFVDQIIAKEVYNESDDTVYTIVPCSSGMDACPGTDGYYAMIWHNASGFSSKFFKLSVVKKEEIADKVRKEYIKRHPNLEKDFAIYFVNTADGIKL